MEANTAIDIVTVTMVHGFQSGSSAVGGHVSVRCSVRVRKPLKPRNNRSLSLAATKLNKREPPE
eukprot:1333575-Amphidinium_carterae.1